MHDEPRLTLTGMPIHQQAIVIVIRPKDVRHPQYDLIELLPLRFLDRYPAWSGEVCLNLAGLREVQVKVGAFAIACL